MLRFILSFGLALLLGSCSEAPPKTNAELISLAENSSATHDVELGCGMCTFKHAGLTRCELYLKNHGKIMPVEGHSVSPMELGLCASKQPVESQLKGAIIDEKFIALHKPKIPYQWRKAKKKRESVAPPPNSKAPEVSDVNDPEVPDATPSIPESPIVDIPMLPSLF
jgi:hypothetical protein